MSDWQQSNQGGTPPPPAWGAGTPGAPPPAPGFPPAGPQPGFGGPPQYYQQPGTGASNGVAIAAMVVGICSIVFAWVPFLGLVLGVVALILGFVGLKKANEVQTGRGMAITGVITGILGILAGILWLVLVFWAADQAINPDAGTLFGDSVLCSQGDQAACDRLGIPNPVTGN